MHATYDYPEAVLERPAVSAVRDVMTRNPRTVSPGTSVDEAHTLMQHYHIRHLPVVERGRLVGIVSDRDIRLVLPSPATSLAVHELRYLLAHLTVREIMQHPVLTIKLESPLTAAVRLMLQHHIDALPVVAHGRLLGILTRSDILQEFVTLQTGLPVAA